MTQAETPRTTAPTLRGDRVFLRFWVAASVTIAGTLVTSVVLPILVYQLTGSAWETSLLVAIETIPYLAFGLIAGAVADRVDRRILLCRCELTSAALLASIPVADAAGVLTVAQIYVVAVATATVFVWFDAANFGAIPAIAGRDRIAAAYSRINATATVLMIVSPALGGVLAATIGPAPAMGIDAASCVISALLLLSIRRPFASAEGGGEGIPARMRERIAEGLRFLWHHPTIRSLTLLGFGNSLALGGVTGLMVVYAHRQLGLPRTSALIGVLYASGAVGSLLCTSVLPRLMRRFSVLIIRLAGVSAELALLAGFALATGLIPAMVLLAALSAASEAVILSGIIYRQQVTPDHLQSRVNVVARMIAWGGQPFGAVLAGAIASVSSVRAGLLTGGVALAAVLVLSVAGPLRVRAPDAVPAAAAARPQGPGGSDCDPQAAASGM
ncbi:MAG: MFS transporter [Actinomycetota bacterium]